METYIYINKTNPQEVFKKFNEGVNKNAEIRYYNFIDETKCKALIRHSEDVILKENATYSLIGFINRCDTKLDKLKRKLFDLETKLYFEQDRQHQMLNNRGWGYGMTHSKIGFSTRREDSIKERIANIKQQIKELEL